MLALARKLSKKLMKTILPFNEAVVAVLPAKSVKPKSVFSKVLLPVSFFICALKKPVEINCFNTQDFAPGLTTMITRNNIIKDVNQFFLSQSNILSNSINRFLIVERVQNKQ